MTTGRDNRRSPWFRLGVMDVELREALAHGFGPEPPHSPIAERIDAGHRAVRRRRMAGAVAAVVVAATVGIGATLLLGGQPSRDTDIVASDPPSTVPKWEGDDLAHYTDEGDLEVRPGTTELDRIDSPYPARAGMNRSVALSLQFEGEETWWLLSWTLDADGKVIRTGDSFGPGGSAETFDEWVRVMVQLNLTPRPEDSSAGYVHFADDGSLVATHGIEILAAVQDPPLKDFVLNGEPSAAALLQGPDGKKWFVLVRDVGGVETISTPFRTGGSDLDAFLAYARERYASGEGLR
jgi:hypothetical protein